MKLVAVAVRFWSIVTLVFHVRQPLPSLTWCVTLSWVWWKLTRWSNNVVPSFRPISILWANCWNLNKVWWWDRILCRLARIHWKLSILLQRMWRPPPPLATSVQSLLVVTYVIYRLHVGPIVTNLLPKWNPAVVFKYFYMCVLCPFLFKTIHNILEKEKYVNPTHPPR